MSATNLSGIVAPRFRVFKAFQEQRLGFSHDKTVTVFLSNGISTRWILFVVEVLGLGETSNSKR